jgi:hypothetical protein
MGGNTACNFTQEIAGYNGIGIGTAYAERGLGRDPAGTHVAYPAAESLGPEGALIHLLVHTEKAQINAVLLSLMYRFNRCRVTGPFFCWFHAVIHDSLLLQT